MMEPQSPLLQLPGELRNHIYELVAADDEPVQVVRRFDDGDNSDMKSKDQDFRSNYAGLTRVCRQIRDEYLPIHRKYARISLRYTDLEQWMKLLGDHPPIKELEVRIPTSRDWPNEDYGWRARIDWLPLLQARASSRSSESDHFRVTVHFSDTEFLDLASSYLQYWTTDRDRKIVCLQQLIDVQNTYWLELLCNDPCPLENVFLCASYGAVGLAFKRTQSFIDLEDSIVVFKFCDNLGFENGRVLFDHRGNPTLEAQYVPDTWH